MYQLKRPKEALGKRHREWNLTIARNIKFGIQNNIPYFLIHSTRADNENK